MSWNQKATADALMKAPVIQFETAPADAVPTVRISSEFYRDFRESGVDALKAMQLFAEAHSSLQIALKYDRKIQLGWVSSDEAKAIRQHMFNAL